MSLLKIYTRGEDAHRSEKLAHGNNYSTAAYILHRRWDRYPQEAQKDNRD